MSKVAWGNIAAAAVFGSIALGLSYAVWGGESDGDRAIRRAQEVSADIDKTLAELELYYTPEQRAEHRRSDQIRGELMTKTHLWQGMPDDDWLRLTFVGANLVTEGVCTLAEIEAAGFKLTSQPGEPPAYQTRCAGGGKGGLVIAYPATMEYRAEPPK